MDFANNIVMETIHCSKLDAIQNCEEISGRELTCTDHVENRVGDPIWYSSNVSCFRSRDLDWRLNHNVTGILQDIYGANRERWSEAKLA